MHQYILNLIGLFDLDTDAYAIDTGLDKDPFVFVAGDGERIEQDFG